MHQHFKKEKVIGHWTYRVSLAFRQQIEKRTRELGIGETEGFILVYLHKEPSSLARIADRLGHAHPSVLRHLDTLEKHGYIVRKPHASDRRVKMIELTPAGRELIPQLLTIFREVNTQATAGLSQEDTEVILRNLKLILKNLDY
jgi:DNA-binding MarR family transcriptional regulator